MRVQHGLIVSYALGIALRNLTRICQEAGRYGLFVIASNLNNLGINKARRFWHHLANERRRASRECGLFALPVGCVLERKVTILCCLMHCFW